MARTTSGSWLRALVAGMGLLAASARPADATFTVSVSGATTTITQTDTDALIVTQMPDGGLVLSASGPLQFSPPTINLVVRGSDAPTPSQLFVVLDSPLPGSLMLDLPGASTTTVRGGAATIGGALRIKGGAGRQVVRLGTAGETLTVEKTATIDLAGGDDELLVQHGGRVEGSLNVKGVNQLTAQMLTVDRSFTFDVHAENVWSNLDTGGLVVGKSLKVIGGPNVDQIAMSGGSVGRSVTLDFDGDLDSAYLFFDTIGGNVKASYGPNGEGIFALGYNCVVKGSLALTMLGSGNDVHIDGAIQGTSLKYTGGPGRDDLSMPTSAPRANATIVTGDGEDDVDFFSTTRLKRLKLDLGDGVDTLGLNGFVLPPGSTVTGLP